MTRLYLSIIYKNYVCVHSNDESWTILYNQGKAI